MKFLILFMTFLSLQAQATGDLEEYISVRSEPLRDQSLVEIFNLATSLIQDHKLSRHPNSCAEAHTFRGPTAPQSALNLQLWINGIGHEMAAVNQIEGMNLHAINPTHQQISQKIQLLADRNYQEYDPKGVAHLSKVIFNEAQKSARDYYFLFGDYLDGNLGWMTAVVLVKLSSGEAVLIANTNDCF